MVVICLGLFENQGDPGSFHPGVAEYNEHFTTQDRTADVRGELSDHRPLTFYARAQGSSGEFEMSQTVSAIFDGSGRYVETKADVTLPWEQHETGGASVECGVWWQDEELSVREFFTAHPVDPYHHSVIIVDGG